MRLVWADPAGSENTAVGPQCLVADESSSSNEPSTITTTEARSCVWRGSTVPGGNQASVTIAGPRSRSRNDGLPSVTGTLPFAWIMGSPRQVRERRFSLDDEPWETEHTADMQRRFKGRAAGARPGIATAPC